MADQRSTRWEKATEDWRGVRAKREVVVGVFGAIVGAGALALTGEGGAAQELIAAGATALVAVVVVPLAELAWHWSQAPMRLLSADVAAIRDHVSALPSAVAAPGPAPIPKPPDVRLWLLEHARKGDALLNYTSVPTDLYEAWTSEASEFLREHARAAEAEEFLTIARRDSTEAMLQRQIEAVRAIARSH